MTLIRISPDGKEVLHLYNDRLVDLVSKTSEMSVERASDIFFDNETSMWKIKILATKEILPVSFIHRGMAQEYEKIVLEDRLREGVV